MPKRFKVEISEAADQDLNGLYDYIADATSGAVAAGYLRRIQQSIDGLAMFPERGTIRNDLRRGVRVIGFEGRVAILFMVDGDVVRILGVMYGGRDIAARFRSEDDPAG